MSGRPWVLLLIAATVAVVTAAGLMTTRESPDPVVAVEPIRLPSSTTSSSQPTGTSTIPSSLVEPTEDPLAVPASPQDPGSSEPAPPAAPLARPEPAPTPTFRPLPLDDDAIDELEDAEDDRNDAAEDRADHERDSGDD